MGVCKSWKDVKKLFEKNLIKMIITFGQRDQLTFQVRYLTYRTPSIREITPIEKFSC